MVKDHQRILQHQKKIEDRMESIEQCQLEETARQQKLAEMR